MSDLHGKVAIVTGAGQGLGEAIARRLSAEGCKVVIADLLGENAEKVAASLPEAKSSSSGWRKFPALFRTRQRRPAHRERGRSM